MAKKDKYGIRDLQRDFPTDAICLDAIFTTLHSKECSCGGRYNRITGRKKYQCSKCRYQIAPTAGTIFHKSDTPLTIWFCAIYLFSNAKSGLSAKQLERDLNVTYKTAWRMLMLIRKSLAQDTKKLSGDVEMDEMYFGGRKRAGHNNKKLSEAILSKSIISGAIERQGNVRAKVIPVAGARALSGFLADNVEPTATLFTDSSNRYQRAAKEFDHYIVNHAKRVFSIDDIHVNTIESWWGHLKRSIQGNHKAISKKYLQSYLDGFAFHYNNRHNDNQRFAVLLSTVLHAPRVAL